MKKRKIAVFSTGWSGEYMQEALSGIIDLAYDRNIDVFSFVNFSIRADLDVVNICEDNIYRLADIKEFDGVFLFANTFNQDWEHTYLIGEINKYNIPCMSLEYPIEGISYISSDNYYGMHELVEHMIINHDCRDFMYVSGPSNHSEAMDRLRAFRDAVVENGLSLTEDMITYGDWSKAHIPEIMDGWIEAHGRYPEAIICANDIMALAVCAYLKDRHVSIPEQVKVTGYDRIRLAQTASPSIASVNHEWRTMGTKAMESLITLMDGGTLGKHITLKNRFVPGGSCGCRLDLSTTDFYQRSAKAITNNIIDPIDLDSHFRHFYTAVRKADNVEAAHNSLSYLFNEAHIIEGNEFKLCLVSNFFDIKETDDNLSDIGYSENMDLLCNISDGLPKPLSSMPLKDCIYESADRKEEAGYYIFLPLYSEGKTYGFAMLSGPLNAANENQYYIWSRHMIAALEQIRSNMRMTLLWNALTTQSITDQLTGVYNRHGCEQNIYANMIAHGKKNEDSLLFLIDVDNMKIINDKFGHAYGDESLKMVVRAMNEVLPDELCPARFGGDEFIIGGPAGNISDAPERIVEAIEDRLSEIVAECEPGLPLSVSIGYAVCCPEDITDIEKAIVVADQNMYVAKDKHHNKRTE